MVREDPGIPPESSSGCKSDAGGALGAQKWFVYFADYILKRAWSQIPRERGAGDENGTAEGD